MQFNSKDSAFQYMTQRKNEILADINRERTEYSLQYQKVRAIPEVRALVNEVVRLMREKYYSRVEIQREYILLRNSSHGYDPTAVKVHYHCYNLNTPQSNRIGFIKFLCEEVYKQTGNDLQLDIVSSFNGSYNVVACKYHLKPLDDDLGTPPAHNCSRRVARRISGRNIITEITDFRTRYCSIDYYQVDSYHRTDLFRRDASDIAEFPEGFFRRACFYELTHMSRMSPHNATGLYAFLFNAAPDPNSKPSTKVNW